MNEALNGFIEELKEETLPGIWSKGVQFSRAVNSIEFISTEKGEWKFKIKTTERLLAYSVTLWIDEHDSHCNCGSKVEPCHHIVAVSLALQNGTVRLEKSDQQPHLEYQWKIDESKGILELQRFIVSESGRAALASSLISYVSGIQSGRLHGKLPSTSSTDLKIDEILNRSTFPASKGSWKDLLDCLAELAPVSGFSIQKGNSKPVLRIQNGSEGVDLILEPLSKADLIFTCGVERVGSVLRLSAPTPPFRIPPSIPRPQFEKFLTESLPALSDYFEVINESTVLPTLVDRDPFIDFKIVALQDGRIALTPTLSYGALAPNELAIQDRAQEQELIRDLRQNQNLSLNQTVYLTASELFQKRGLSPEVDRFAHQYFVGLLDELKVDYSTLDLEKQENAILHLLQQKTSAGFSAQAQVIANSLRSRPSAHQGPENTLPIPTTVPRSIWNQLRDYQKQGVYWLSERNTAGAILADDMGLGKTIQTLAIVQSPTLIVAPTSLLHNWKDEAARFRPDLKVNVYHGSNRQWNSEADLVITSYGILRTDLETFRLSAEQSPWKMMALDEAHQIRNQDTLAAQAAFQVPALMKIALTGTPVQNRRSDLFSLFQFVSPGLFRSESELNPERVAPFVLRRKKEEVLKELPPKTHLLHEIQLSETERGRYHAVWAAAKAEVLTGLGTKANPITMFEALLRARQSCDHIGLFYEPEWKTSSSKLSYLMGLVRELMDAGHSVLVYSQWTRFLDRIEEELQDSKGESVPYERLDGSTMNRSQVVKDFQNASESKVFLLSLHAGGVGLNLTKATHVIFCDPWWNPFVEIQAEDRAYRMGQEKPVTIHRLVCENTIEEKLLEIQRQKKSGAQDVLGSAESGVTFTEADLRKLLE